MSIIKATSSPVGFLIFPELEELNGRKMHYGLFNVKSQAKLTDEKSRKRIKSQAADPNDIHNRFVEVILENWPLIIRSFPIIDTNAELMSICDHADLSTVVSNNASCKYSNRSLESINKLQDLVNAEISSSVEATLKVEGHSFLIPKNSTIYLSSFDAITEWIENHSYDLIYLDPPWINASASRSKSYESFDCFELFDLPVKKTLAKEGLVMIWVTNNSKYHKFITNKLFPVWGLEVVQTWIWVKLTTDGEPVFGFKSDHRKPYEVLYIGKRLKKIKVVPLRIFATVTTLHSRKPPLDDLLHGIVLKDAKKLEVFARQVREGWTCCGNEVLKFNNKVYFESI